MEIGTNFLQTKGNGKRRLCVNDTVEAGIEHVTLWYANGKENRQIALLSIVSNTDKPINVIQCNPSLLETVSQETLSQLKEIVIMKKCNFLINTALSNYTENRSA